MTRIEGEIVIAAPVEQVFDTVADERNEPRYNPRIIRAQKTSPGPVGRGTLFTAEPRGMGSGGVMTVQVVDYDRPRRLGTSVRSSYMAADGTLTFAPANAGGTWMRWSWDVRLRGAMRVLSPLIRVMGPQWEYRNWAGLKRYAEGASGGAARTPPRALGSRTVRLPPRFRGRVLRRGWHGGGRWRADASW